MRIGITMRTQRETAYVEVRDALDRAWWRFLAAALPGDAVVPIPNAGRRALDTFAALDLGGLILTGGEDPGTSPERDETERLLLEHCVARALPVLGVCRGLQLVALSLAGARLMDCDPARHRATRHEVTLDPGALGRSLPPRLETNSYHNRCVELPGRDVLLPVAWAPDGVVEGLLSRDGRILAIGWHPEREPTPRELEAGLVRDHFHPGPGRAPVQTPASPTHEG